MKIKKIVLLLLLITIILSLAYHFIKKGLIVNTPLTKDVNVVPTMLDEIGNDTTWCATFQLIWNDLKNDVVKKDIIFTPQEKIATNLNKEEFTEKMISDEYYYKVYGPKTIELKKEIKQAIKKKFNQESDILNDFNWNSDNALEQDKRNYFFYTMLYREFKYKAKFNKLESDYFGKYKNIEYFGLDGDSTTTQREQIQVLFYNSENDFAIKINTKNSDEVIFYKNPKGKTFKEIYDNIVKNSNDYNGNKNFEETDRFKAPYLNLNIKKEYSEIEKKNFKTIDNENCIIEKAIQTIKFSIDEKGGRIKSEAAMDFKYTSIEPLETREFFLNDMFAIFLKEEKKQKPYFALKVSDITKYQKHSKN